MAGQVRDAFPLLDLDLSAVPEPDEAAEPDGFIVEVAPGERLHFLDWGGPTAGPRAVDSASEPPVLLIHGLAQTSWIWTPVARRLRTGRRVVAMDLRGHGLSDSPTHGYEPGQLADDAIAVADGAGLLESGAGPVLAGHGAGAMVAGWTAATLAERCAGLVLVDGGWERLAETTDLEPDEFLRSLEEPPEVMRSMSGFLADRRGFDPATWDADQERAARATVIEVPAGKVVPAVRPHALAGFVQAMFAYRPDETLARVAAPIVALVATDDELRRRHAAMLRLERNRSELGQSLIPVALYPSDGHNLMRYRPVEVTAAILTVGVTDSRGGRNGRGGPDRRSALPSG
jgi:pimeloyl-ACP methyl ester carboxylesterase